MTAKIQGIEAAEKLNRTSTVGWRTLIQQPMGLITE